MDQESHSSVLCELYSAFYHLLHEYEFTPIEELVGEYHQLLSEYEFLETDYDYEGDSVASWVPYYHERDSTYDQQMFAWEMARLEVRDDNIEFFNRHPDQVTPLDISLSTAFVIGERLNHRQSARQMIEATGQQVYVSLVEELREGELRSRLNDCLFGTVERSGRRVLYVQGNGVQWRGDRLSTYGIDSIGVYATEIRDYSEQVITAYIASADREQLEDPSEDDFLDVEYVDPIEAELQVWHIYEDEQLAEHEDDSDYEAWLEERNERMWAHYEEVYNSYGYYDW